MKIIGVPQVFFDFLYQNQRFAYKTNGFGPKIHTFHAFHTFLTFHTFCGDSSSQIWSGVQTATSGTLVTFVQSQEKAFMRAELPCAPCTHTRTIAGFASVLCCALLCSTLLYSAALGCALLCCAVLVMCSAIILFLTQRFVGRSPFLRPATTRFHFPPEGEQRVAPFYFLQRIRQEGRRAFFSTPYTTVRGEV